jgi:Ser-tRNA(Ala) deacylase AlaX
MRKVFWDDPYQTALTTTVEAVNGNQVLFANTIAFSFSGGQESDRALVNNIPVLDSKIVGNLIYYT